MRFIAAILGFGVWSLFGLSANADVFQVEGVAVELPNPQGYCPLSREAQPLLYQKMEGMQRVAGNRLLVISRPCEKSAETMNEWSQWTVFAPKGVIMHRPSQLSKTETIAQISKSIPQISMPELRNTVEGLFKGEGIDLQIDTQPYLIDLDEDALFIGFVLKPANGEGLILGVTALTIVGDFIFNFSSYKVGQSANDHQILLKNAKAIVAHTTE